MEEEKFNEDNGNAFTPLEKDDLEVCTSMPSNMSGELLELYRNKAVVRFTPTERMIMDESTLMKSTKPFNLTLQVLQQWQLLIKNIVCLLLLM